MVRITDIQLDPRIAIVPALRLAALVVAFAALASRAGAQCRPPASSHEARLLAFYEAPTAFSMSAAPSTLAAGALRVGAEVVPVPRPAPALERPEYCYNGSSNDSHLAPLFGRPRVTLGLPYGFALEGSWLPRVRISGAEAELASVALSRTQDVAIGGRALAIVARAHATTGRIRGAITCPASALQASDPSAPCWGRSPSRDTFRPHASGLELAAGAGRRDGRFAAYLGGGVSRLRPRFETGFTYANGGIDRTPIVVNLARGSAFAGATAGLWGPLSLSAQLYSVPADVTTFRAAVEYRAH